MAVGYIDTDDDSGYQIAVGGTYYFNTMFGIGLNAGIADVGDVTRDTVGIDASFFPSEQVELTLSIFDSSTEFNNIDVDSDGIMFGAAMRF